MAVAVAISVAVFPDDAKEKVKLSGKYAVLVWVSDPETTQISVAISVAISMAVAVAVFSH